MKVESKKFNLKDGREVEFRCLCADDAAEMIKCVSEVNRQSHYFMKTPEETVSEVNETTIAERVESIKKNSDNPLCLQLGVFVDGILVGNLGFNAQNLTKVKHRASFGIGLKEAYCSLGIGTKAIEYLFSFAPSMGIEQIELGVYSDNPRAYHVYEKLGFVKYGVCPGAFRLKDGSYIDEILMYKKV